MAEQRSRRALKAGEFAAYSGPAVVKGWNIPKPDKATSIVRQVSFTPVGPRVRTVPSGAILSRFANSSVGPLRRSGEQ